MNAVNPEGLESTDSNIKAPDFHELLRVWKCMFYKGKTKEAEPQAHAEVKKKKCRFRPRTRNRIKAIFIVL